MKNLNESLQYQKNSDETYAEDVHCNLDDVPEESQEPKIFTGRAPNFWCDMEINPWGSGMRREFPLMGRCL